MPKAERGTPKDIANRIKAKGLQKLKFYCQMCQKQCRDANGFKCHMTSESHLRNMKLFSENASGIMDGMSKEFEKTYLDTLRRRHGTKRVNANNIYQDVIRDRHHIHMNATKWTSLTSFCQYLGRTGKCIVEETERGWYIQYIERDAGILARQEAQQRRVEAEQEAEARFAKQMELQRVEAAKALDRAGGTVKVEATKIQRGEDNDQDTRQVTLSLQQKRKQPTASNQFFVFGGDDPDDEDDEDDGEPQKRALKQLEAFAARTDSRKEERPSKRLRRNADAHERDRNTEKSSSDAAEYLKDVRKDYWLRRDILVRIISKKLSNGRYFKRKAVVERVLDDKFTAEVEVLNSGPDEDDGGDVLRLDQDDLETVVPKEGKAVRILNGRGRGKQATVLSLNPNRYKARLELEDGTILEKIDYEDFSKNAS